MNNVILKGRLTKDPEIRTNGDKSVARLTVAVNRRGVNGQNDSDFIPCVAFGKTAETMSKYLAKGREVVIRGNIRTGSYTNKDGQKVYTTDVWVDEFEFCGSKNDAPAPSSNNAPAPATNSDGFMHIPDGVGDEGLPFN